MFPTADSHLPFAALGFADSASGSLVKMEACEIMQEVQALGSFQDRETRKDARDLPDQIDQLTDPPQFSSDEIPKGWIRSAAIPLAGTGAEGLKRCQQQVCYLSILSNASISETRAPLYRACAPEPTDKDCLPDVPTSSRAKVRPDFGRGFQRVLSGESALRTANESSRTTIWPSMHKLWKIQDFGIRLQTQIIPFPVNEL